MNQSNSMEDNQLVRKCRHGETEEFKKVVEKYRTKTMALALNILGNRAKESHSPSQ